MVSSTEQTKTINIKGTSFKFDIKNFSVQDYLTIEADKQRISGGNYANIAVSPLINSRNAANLIDMIATFRTLNQDIENCVTGKDFSKLNMIDSKELLNVYINEFLPWYTKWLEEFNVPFVDENQEEDSADDKKE